MTRTLPVLKSCVKWTSSGVEPESLACEASVRPLYEQPVEIVRIELTAAILQGSLATLEHESPLTGKVANLSRSVTQAKCSCQVPGGSCLYERLYAGRVGFEPTLTGLEPVVLAVELSPHVFSVLYAEGSPCNLFSQVFRGASLALPLRLPSAREVPGRLARQPGEMLSHVSPEGEPSRHET